MATYYRSHPTNRALSAECWTLTLDEAKRAGRVLRPEIGTYWYGRLMRPYRSAQRAGESVVRVITAGFTTGEFSNTLAAAGIAVAERDTY